jgi:signal transduction histidine kinase
LGLSRFEAGDVVSRFSGALLQRPPEERLRLAHELHDVVSHTLAVVGVHINDALDAIDKAPDEARESLRRAQEVRDAAMADLKSHLRTLVEPEREAESPTRHLDNLGALVEGARRAGLAVAFDETGDRSSVPGPFALAAYRIVQEALTNTLRHAGARHVAVVLRYETHRVAVLVADDGTAKTNVADGYGLAGMRARVRALGGSLETGPARGGGFRVYAILPVASTR